MTTQVRKLEEILTPGEITPAAQWQIRAVQSEQCQSYVAWNTQSREALAVDPKREDLPAYGQLARELQGYRWLAVVDTHTHADHISSAFDLAEQLGAPVVMHEKSPSRRVHIRVGRDTAISSLAAPLKLIVTPGHTADSISVAWGPYFFGGDTVLFGDTGRDDLPGGDPVAHYQSLVTLKAALSPEAILLPGHDHKGGRASSWAHQLKTNASLTQGREQFVAEASAFEAPAPALLKESLRENFK